MNPLSFFFIFSFIFISVMTNCGGSTADNSSSETESTIVTWAGEGTQGYDGGDNSLLESWFNEPMEMIFDAEGQCLIVDWNSHKIRYESSEETLETIIGTELPGDWPCQDPTDSNNCEVSLDDTIAGADLDLNHPMDIALASDGVFYIAAWHNHKILQYNPDSGTVSVVGGGQEPGFSGDGGGVEEALFNFPSSLVFDNQGKGDSPNLFVADQRNNRIRRIANDDNQTVTTVAGSSSPPSTSDYSGDGGPATEAELALTAYDELGGSDNPPPGGALVFDGEGNLYVADTFNHCVRRVEPGSDAILGDGDASEEAITTVAGTCTESGYSGDGGSADLALLNEPFDLEFGPDGRLYIADTSNHVVRAVNVTENIIETVAGLPEDPGFSGDDGIPTEAELNTPYGLAFDEEGFLFILDTLNNRIRKVEL